jgi:hypothetical protein
LAKARWVGQETKESSQEVRKEKEIMLLLRAAREREREREKERKIERERESLRTFYAFSVLLIGCWRSLNWWWRALLKISLAIEGKVDE